MGVQEALGCRRAGAGPFAEGWGWAEVLEGDPAGLTQKAAAWEACPDLQWDTLQNRQFLANLTLDLVQTFVAEERRLRQARSPLLAERRRQNHGLARELRDLMRRADQGLEITEGIRAFLADWRRHQEQSPAVVPPPGLTEH